MDRYSSLPEEEKAKISAKNCERVRSLTGQKLEKYLEYQRNYKRNLTPEQRAAKSAYSKDYEKNLTPEARKKRNDRQKVYAAKRNKEQKALRSKSSCVWAKNNPEKTRARNWKRKAIVRQIDGSFTADEWLALVEQYHGKCASCGKHQREAKLTVDHIFPVSKGGSNSIENIQPLCFPCNASKYDKAICYIGWRFAA